MLPPRRLPAASSMIRPVPTLAMLAVMASSACVATRSASMVRRRCSFRRRKWATASLLGAGGLQRLHRRQDVADGAGDLAGGLAAGGAVAAQRGAGPPRHHRHDHQGQDGDQRHAGVEMQEHQERHHGKQAMAEISSVQSRCPRPDRHRRESG